MDLEPLEDIFSQPAVSNARAGGKLQPKAKPQPRKVKHVTVPTNLTNAGKESSVTTSTIHQDTVYPVSLTQVPDRLSCMAPLTEELNADVIRNRTRDLEGILRSSKDSHVEEASSDVNKLFEEFTSKIKQVGFSNFNSLTSEELDAYLKDAKEQLNEVEAENAKISDDIKVLRSTYVEDTIQLERDYEGLSCTLKLLESQGLDKLQLGTSAECCTLSTGSVVNQHEDYKFELLELDHQIEKKRNTMSLLEDRSCILKRIEAVGQIEDMFTGIKVVDFDGSEIRLSLETFIPTLDDFFSQQKMVFTSDPPTVNHELFIEVYDGTLELKNVEIFPDDIFMDEIIKAAKSSRKFCSSLSLQGVLQWFVQKVQDRIILCTLRRLIVKDANKSRHSFEYSDRDETVIAHTLGGIDAFIKLPHYWPIVNSILKLTSLKCQNNRKKKLSLSSCQVEELLSSMDVQAQQNLLNFVDAIEELLAKRI